MANPLMFAIHPAKLNEEKQYHLIVENIWSYQALLPVLTETSFSTLIYGSGKKVIDSIEQFSMQYPVNGEHQFFYFGDMDTEDISIWLSLNKMKAVAPAIPFYSACLKKKAAITKGNEKDHSDALDEFYKYFTMQEKNQIRTLLGQGKSLPQQSLKTTELQKIWREWKMET